MSRYIALGLDQQGRHVPTLARRHLEREERAGVCNTCPGELDAPEAVFLAEPTPSYGWVVGAMAGIGLAAVAALHLALRFSEAVLR